MPAALEEQANRTIRRLLYQDWEPSNTLGYAPDVAHTDAVAQLPIHYGNYNAELSDPQISVVQPQGEFTVGGRWSGKRNGTAAMNQYRRGMVIVQCWAESGSSYQGEDAQDTVSVLRVEVERVLGAYADGPSSGPNAGVITALSTQWDGRFPETNNEVTAPPWQSQVTVTYDWERQQ